jgi:hypothetical protein
MIVKNYTSVTGLFSTTYGVQIKINHTVEYRGSKLTNNKKHMSHEHTLTIVPTTDRIITA